MSGALFARNIQMFVNDNLSPQQFGRFVARSARQARDDLIHSGQAPRSYRTFVDGREGAPEESVRKAILYQFNLLGQAAAFALAHAVGRSPTLEGDYKKGWFVAVNGTRWTDKLDDIPPGSEVLVTNDRPYHRKIDVGAMRMRVPGTSQIVEATRQAALKRFPNLAVWRRFVTLPDGYVLKGPRSRIGRAGQQMTYPAVVIVDRQ